MERFRDSSYASWVEKSMFERGDIKKIVEQIGEDGLYLIGGAVRDPIVNFLYNKDLKVSDYDFFSSNRNSEELREIFRDYDNVIFSRFGNPKFIFDDYEIDVVAFDNTIAEKKYGKSPDIEGVLSSSDINTSSIAYSLSNSDFYSYLAMEGILNSRVDILNKTFLPADLSRLILHSEKLGFSLSEKSSNFIKQNYAENMDLEIIDYLKYKKKEKSVDSVLAELKKIKFKE